MHLANMPFRTAFIQIVKILRTLYLLIICLVAEGLLNRGVLLHGCLKY
jgi:phage-related holin